MKTMTRKLTILGGLAVCFGLWLVSAVEAGGPRPVVPPNYQYGTRSTLPPRQDYTPPRVTTRLPLQVRRPQRVTVPNVSRMATRVTAPPSTTPRPRGQSRFERPRMTNEETMNAIAWQAFPAKPNSSVRRQTTPAPALTADLRRDRPTAAGTAPSAGSTPSRTPSTPAWQGTAPPAPSGRDMAPIEDPRVGDRDPHDTLRPLVPVNQPYGITRSGADSRTMTPSGLTIDPRGGRISFTVPAAGTAATSSSASPRAEQRLRDDGLGFWVGNNLNAWLIGAERLPAAVSSGRVPAVPSRSVGAIGAAPTAYHLGTEIGEALNPANDLGERGIHAGRACIDIASLGLQTIATVSGQPGWSAAAPNAEFLGYRLVDLSARGGTALAGWLHNPDINRTGAGDATRPVPSPGEIGSETRR